MRQLILIAFLLIPSVVAGQEDWGPADWLSPDSWNILCGGPGFGYGVSMPTVTSNDSLIFFYFACFDSSRIAYSYYYDNDWQAPITVPPEIIGNHAFDPFFSEYDSTLYYCLDDDSNGVNSDIWAVRFEGGLWSQPWNLGEPINTRDNEAAPSMPLNGDRLYFLRNDSIMYADNTNGQFDQPIALPSVINSDQFDTDPRISPDGTVLYFNRGSNVYQPAPMYASHLQDGVWQEPVLLNDNIRYRERIPYCLMIPGHNARPSFSCNGTKMYFWHFEPFGQFCEPWNFIMVSFLTDAIDEDGLVIPHKLSLIAYPNPFNSEIKIVVSSKADQPIEFAVYNLAGQKVRVLPSEPEVLWDGKDSKGKSVSSGVYFVKAKSSELSKVVKITLLR